MGCCSNSKKIDQAILEKARGLINQAQLDYFYMTYNYTQDEIITIIDEFQKLNLNEKGLLYPEDLIDFPPFHFSPFGYHILDALDLKVIDKKRKFNIRRKNNIRNKNH